MGEQLLIVEDNRLLLELMKLKLENKGYRVKKAENGLDALNVVKRNKIDLIISDIMMPEISGLNLMSLLNDYNTEKIPVIVMSSNDQESTIASAKKLGAVDYIVKPVNFEEMCEKISYVLHSKNESKKETIPEHKKYIS